jgi:hypothetical protein
MAIAASGRTEPGVRRRAPARGPQRAGEAEPVGVGVGVGLQRDGASASGRRNRRTGSRRFPGGRRQASCHPRSALVGLQLVQGGLELPPLRVQRSQPGGGRGSRSRMVVMPESASREGTGTGQIWVTSSRAMSSGGSIRPPGSRLPARAAV